MNSTQTIDQELAHLREQLEQANRRDFIRRQRLILSIHQLELKKGD